MRKSAQGLHAYLTHLFYANYPLRRQFDPDAFLRQFLDDPRNSPNDPWGPLPGIHPAHIVSYFEAWIRTHDIDGSTTAQFLARGADSLTGGLNSVAFYIIRGSDDPAPITQLLDAGLPLDAQWGIDGWNLFHAAAVFNSQERKSRLVPVLIERAVQAGRLDLLQAPSTRNDQVPPVTPMDVALQVGNWDTVRQFCAHVTPSERVRESGKFRAYCRDPIAA